ncbi:MAG: YceI family protein [Xanthomonadales bacterium]|nr:YceI family protein [Xanthomonadales bacterium]
MNWIALLALATAPTCNIGETWELDGSASRLGFTATLEGEPFHGRFPDFAVQLCFDPEQPDSAWLLVAVELSSVATGDADRDAALAAPEWFNSETHPSARYQAAAFESLGDNRFTASGELQIKHIQRGVPINFQWISGDGSARLKGMAQMIGDTEVNRLDFDLGRGDWADDALIGHRVDVEFDLTLRRADH